MQMYDLFVIFVSDVIILTALYVLCSSSHITIPFYPLSLPLGGRDHYEGSGVDRGPAHLHTAGEVQTRGDF